MIKLRSVRQAVREIQESDPCTAMTETLLKRLIHEGDVSYTTCGARELIEMETLGREPPQRESIKDYRRITCEIGKYLAKQPQNFRNEPTSSRKTMNQTVKTMHRIALVFAMESCMKNA